MRSRELGSIRNWIRQKVQERVLEIGSRFRILRSKEELPSVLTLTANRLHLTAP
jgi:hypothetical protein